eukprot:656959-Alexandrium_andersonii.AAC.1
MPRAAAFPAAWPMLGNRCLVRPLAACRHAAELLAIVGGAAPLHPLPRHRSLSQTSVTATTTDHCPDS